MLIENNINFKARICNPVSSKEKKARIAKVTELLQKAIEQNQVATLSTLSSESGYSVRVIREILGHNKTLRRMYDDMRQSIPARIRATVTSAALLGTLNINNPQIKDELDDYAKVLTKELYKMGTPQDEAKLKVLMNTFSRNPILVDDIVGFRFSNGMTRCVEIGTIKTLERSFNINPDLTLDLMHEEDKSGYGKFLGSEIENIVEIVNEHPELLESLKNNYRFVNKLYNQKNPNGTSHCGIQDIKDMSDIYATSKHRKYLDTMINRTIADGKYLYELKDIIYIEKELNGDNVEFAKSLIDFCYRRYRFDTDNGTQYYFTGADIVKILESVKKLKDKKLQKLLLDKTLLGIDTTHDKRSIKPAIIAEIFEASTKENNVEYLDDLFKILSSKEEVNLYNLSRGFTTDGIKKGINLYKLLRGSISKSDYKNFANRKVTVKISRYKNGICEIKEVQQHVFSKEELAEIKQLVQ